MVVDNIIENSYYDHIEYGRVKVVDVDATTVSMELQEDTTVIGSRTIPVAKYEQVSDFKHRADPADITVAADPAVFDIFGHNM